MKLTWLYPKISNFLMEILFPEDKSIVFLKKIKIKDLLPNVKIRKFQEAYYLFDYKIENIKNLIWYLKFKKQKGLALILGRILELKLEKILEIEKIKKNEEMILIPIPIHKKRLKERGYNQCDLISKSLMREFQKKTELKFGVIYKPNILIRSKYTQKQSWSNKKERQKNLKNVFVVDKKFKKEISCKKIILIDDVITTGSTIGEAKKVLLESGAVSVMAICLAH